MWRAGAREKRAAEATPAPMAGADADETVVRDAEESLVAALHESDTAVETVRDETIDGAVRAPNRRWTVGFAGLILALLGLLVARRRS